MIQAREILVYFAYIFDGDWDQIYKAIKEKRKINFNDVEELIKKEERNYITLLDDRYPQCLRNIYKPPFVLFYHGDLTLLERYRKTVSIIGIKDGSEYTTKAIQKIVKELPDDYIIVTGMSTGIDETVLNNVHTLSKCIAILGAGIDNCYPKDNLKFYNTIKEQGLILSEYPKLVEPKAEHFPLRNRIISAISDFVLLPEIKKRSAASITLNHALNQGKSVGVIPCSIFEDNINNELISQGAVCITCGTDVLEEISK